jgi:putative hydrolase of the HAD superfamily
MGLRAVTFDLWETLIVDRVDRTRERTGRRVTGVLDALLAEGRNVTEPQIREAYRANLMAMAALRARGQDTSSEEQVRRFLAHIQKRLPDTIGAEALERVTDAYTSLDRDVAPVAMDGAREVLQASRDLGLRIGLISNTGTTPGRVLRRILADNDLIGFFDVLTFSDEVELAKPEPRIFLDTLAQLEVDPGETAHVGDHGKWDVEGGKAAGVRVIKLAHPREDDRETPPDALVDSLHDVPPVLRNWMAS